MPCSFQNMKFAMGAEKLNNASVASNNRLQKLKVLMSKFDSVANNINVSNLM